MRPLVLPFQAFRIRTSRSETSQPLHVRTNIYTDLWNPAQQKTQDLRDEKFRIVVKQASKFAPQKGGTSRQLHKLSRLLLLYLRPTMQVYKVITLPPVGTRKSKTPRVFASTSSLTHHWCKDGACRDPFHLLGMSLKTLMFLIPSCPIPPHIYWSSVRL